MATGKIAPTFEGKVVEDFLFFMEHFQESLDTVMSDRERDICQVIASI